MSNIEKKMSYNELALETVIEAANKLYENLIADGYQYTHDYEKKIADILEKNGYRYVNSSKEKVREAVDGRWPWNGKSYCFQAYSIENGEFYALRGRIEDEKITDLEKHHLTERHIRYCALLAYGLKADQTYIWDLYQAATEKFFFLKYCDKYYERDQELAAKAKLRSLATGK